MLGIIVQLLISWGLLWLVEKENLSVLGLMPSKKRLTALFLFLFVSMACCASGFLLRIIFGHVVWRLNPLFNTRLLFEGAWWNLKSVLFEELIFRGAIFYILIKRIGAMKAILISAIAFGIYHWFSFGIIGNVGQMIQVFFITGIIGLVYAYGYARTKSLYAVIGMHFGWNFTQGFIFSSGSIGNGILVLQKPVPVVNVSYFIYFMISFFPMISFGVINFLLLKYRKSLICYCPSPICYWPFTKVTEWQVSATFDMNAE